MPLSCNSTFQRIEVVYNSDSWWLRTSISPTFQWPETSQTSTGTFLDISKSASYRKTNNRDQVMLEKRLTIWFKKLLAVNWLVSEDVIICKTGFLCGLNLIRDTEKHVIGVTCLKKKVKKKKHTTRSTFHLFVIPKVNVVCTARQNLLFIRNTLICICMSSIKITGIRRALFGKVTTWNITWANSRWVKTLCKSQIKIWKSPPLTIVINIKYIKMRLGVQQPYLKMNVFHETVRL